MKSSSRNVLKELLPWIALAWVAFCVLGLIEVSVQQTLRQSANDPQIAIARDTVHALEGGATPIDIIGASSTDRIAIESSLDPYIIITDSQGIPVAGTGYLGDMLPKLPVGVFSTALAQGEYQVTWQPRADIRQATVLIPYTYQDKQGFVVAGRSLYETEQREDQLTKMVGMTAVGIFGGLLLLALISMAMRKKN